MCADSGSSGSALHRRYALQRLARVLLPAERLVSCVWSLLPSSASVDVLHFPLRLSARYRGVQYCGSAWLCPICASIIAERRRSDIESALSVWRARGGAVALVTLTLAHTASDSLSGLLDALSGAWRDATRRNMWSLFARRVGLSGHIRALEITCGASGWHPHLHVLMFVERPISPRDIVWLRGYWLDRLESVGRGASWWAGVDVRAAGELVDAYVTKLGSRWGVADEMTRTLAKSGRGESLTYPALLSAAESSPALRARLYEYAAATHGRSWIQWSRGLRADLGLSDDVDDEELVYQRTERVIQVLARLSCDDWRRVLANDARAEVLEIAASGDAEALRDYLATLGCALNIGARV